MTERCTTFTSAGRRYSTEADASLLELARQVGLHLPSLCGGRGKCAKCRCYPRGLVSEPTALELEMLTPEELRAGIRLGCQARPLGAVEIALEEERLDKGATGEITVVPEPGLRKVYRWEFVLAWDPYVSITQQDVRHLQLAKATIRCGVQILMEEMGIEPPQVTQVSLAGVFGNFVDKRSALGIGLLPPAFPAARIVGVGNAAGLGSCMALLSRSIRRRAELLARQVEYFELSKHPRFEEIFTDSMRYGENGGFPAG